MAASPLSCLVVFYEYTSLGTQNENFIIIIPHRKECLFVCIVKSPFRGAFNEVSSSSSSLSLLSLLSLLLLYAYIFSFSLALPLYLQLRKVYSNMKSFVVSRSEVRQRERKRYYYCIYLLTDFDMNCI